MYVFLKSRIQTSQDKLKQHFYCFKFLLLFQVVEFLYIHPKQAYALG